MEASYKEGDLVEIKRYKGLTLCHIKYKNNTWGIKELPIEDLQVYSSHSDNIFKTLEGKLGLVVYVARNRLEQTLGYKVLVEGLAMFYKAKVASKYFKHTENQGDESR